MARPAEGGDGSFVGIDPEAMKSLITALTDAQDRLTTIGPRMAAVLARVGLVGYDPGPAMAATADWIRAGLPGLRRRVDLVDADVAWGNPLFPGQKYAAIDESLVGQDAREAAMDGARLADQMWTASSGKSLPPQLTAALNRAQRDPDFAVGFWNRLGPQRAAELVQRLAAQQQRWLNGDRGTDQAGLRTPDEFLNDQQRLIEALSASLGVASRARGDIRLGPDYGRRLAETDARAAGQLLRSGTFGEDFTVQAAEQIYDWRVRNVLRATSDSWEPLRVGRADPGGGDPLVSALAALSHNVEAAQRFLTPRRVSTLMGGTGADSDTGPYRLNLADRGETLGAFIATATTAVRDRGPVGAQSARDAYIAVHAAARVAGDGLPTGVRRSLGELFASYIHDVALATDVNDWINESRADLRDHIHRNQPGVPGGPIGVIFDREDLRAVLPAVEADDDAFRAIRVAAGSYAVGSLIDAARQAREGAGSYTEAEQRVGRLYGLLSSQRNLGAIGEAAAQDERRAAFIADVRTIADIGIEAGKTASGVEISDYLTPWVGLTQDRLEEQIAERFQTHHEAAARVAADKFDDAMRDELHRLACKVAADQNLAENQTVRDRVGIHVRPDRWFDENRHWHQLSDDSKFFDEKKNIIPVDKMSKEQYDAYLLYMDSAMSEQFGEIEHSFTDLRETNR